MEASVCPSQARASARSPAPVARRVDDAAAAESLCEPGRRRARLVKNNPRLRRPRAVAGRALVERRDDGQWHILGDPRTNASIRRCIRQDESLGGLEAHRRAHAVGRGRRNRPQPLVGPPLSAQRFRRAPCTRARVQRVQLPSCGHMPHFDQPQALAAAIEALSRRALGLFMHGLGRRTDQLQECDRAGAAPRAGPLMK